MGGVRPSKKHSVLPRPTRPVTIPFHFFPSTLGFGMSRTGGKESQRGLGCLAANKNPHRPGGERARKLSFINHLAFLLARAQQRRPRPESKSGLGLARDELKQRRPPQ
jgi:hypothetical protein